MINHQSKIRPMLAAQFEEERTWKHLQEDKFLLVQPKIDGMRVLCDDGTARSRSWKQWTNLYIQAFVGSRPDHYHGWDGEMLPGIIEGSPTEEAFRGAQSGLRTADGAQLLTYYLFDNFDPSWAVFPYWQRYINVYRDLLNSPDDEIVPTDITLEEACRASQEGRSVLSLGSQANGLGRWQCLVKLCPTYMIRSLEELYEHEQRFLDSGYEGAIIRRAGRGYKWNRSTSFEGSLTKLKRFVDFEAVIDGVYARQRNDNEATTSALGYTARSSHQGNKVDLEILGGFHCHLLDNPEIEFDVGVLKGLDMGTKEALWKIRDTLKGQVITCVEQGYKGGYDKPRTPVFHRFRDPVEL